MSEIHVLKTWPSYYKMVEDGVKTFEVRKNDRGFHVGDYLQLVEYDPETDSKTGKSICVVVTCIIYPSVCVPLDRGYVIMGIKAVEGGRE